MEQRSDGRAMHGAADGKAGVRRAPRGIVLCGKYSSTCRRVRSALLPACVCPRRTLVSIELWRLVGSAFGPMAITGREIGNFIRKICLRHVCWRIFL